MEWRSDDRARRRRPLPGLRRAGRSAHGPGRPEGLARRNTRTYVNRLVRELGADRLFAELDHEDLTAVLGRLVPERNGKPTGAKPTRNFLSTYALAVKGTYGPAAIVPSDSTDGYVARATQLPPAGPATANKDGPTSGGAEDPKRPLQQQRRR